MKVLVVLQNAWAESAARRWEYRSWVRALKRSRSGRRLSRVFEGDWTGVTFGNTTAAVGEGPDSRLPADPEHVRGLFARHTPDVVVAVGLQAEHATKSAWPGPLLVMPHPASRVLTNGLLDRANELLYGAGGYALRLALRQLRGSVAEEAL